MRSPCGVETQIRYFLYQASEFQNGSENSRVDGEDCIIWDGKIMKIAYLITRSDQIGGAQIHIRDMAKYVTHNGHDVVVLCGGSGPLVEQLAAADIPVITIKHLKREINPYFDILSLFDIIKTLKKEKIDILSCHSSKAGILGRIAARILGLKVIFTAHGWAFADGVSERQRKLYIKIERFFAAITDKIITVSQQDKDLALKYKIADSTMMEAIHNGMPDVHQSLIRKHSNNSDQIKFISVARFSEQKDHYSLLLALEKFNKHHLNWRLDLIGDGPLKSEVEKYCVSLGIRDKVNFIGEVFNVDEYLSKSDVFLLISKWEGFPRSILEAMRAGLPIIASDVGGVRESVIDSVNGFLIQRGDFDSLTKKILITTQDDSLRSLMGVNSRRLYEESFTFDVMANKNMEIYFYLLQGSDSSMS